MSGVTSATAAAKTSLPKSSKNQPVDALHKAQVAAQAYKKLYLESELLNALLKEHEETVKTAAEAHPEWFGEAKSFTLVDDIKVVKTEESVIELDSLLTEDEAAKAVKAIMLKHPKAVKVTFLKKGLANIDLSKLKLTQHCKPCKYSMDW